MQALPERGGLSGNWGFSLDFGNFVSLQNKKSYAEKSILQHSIGCPGLIWFANFSLVIGNSNAEHVLKTSYLLQNVNEDVGGVTHKEGDNLVH